MIYNKCILSVLCMCDKILLGGGMVIQLWYGNK